MNPYRKAFESYHSDGEPHIRWADALDFHLQYGTVISTPTVFLMVRKVDAAMADHDHAELIPAIDRLSRDWHVWSAAGNLREILAIAREHGARRVTWQKRSAKLHWHNVPDLSAKTVILPPVQSLLG